MDIIVYKYRRKHPRCKYCEYRAFASGHGIVSDYYRCDAKDKMLSDLDIPRWFCSCYKVKE